MAMKKPDDRYDVSIRFEIEPHQFCQESVEWAAEYLGKTLRDKGAVVHEGRGSDGSENACLQIVLTGAKTESVRELSQEAGKEIPDTAEAFGIFSKITNGRQTITASGHDTRGLLYAALELADIVKHTADPLCALAGLDTVVEKPHNAVRSITRLFSSEIEDKSWFYDRGFWDDYLTELATQRFNQFTFGVGGGYDFLIDKIVLDTYFCFLYPYLLSVPGYEVQVSGLSVQEQHDNLNMLQYISEQAKLRGLRFCLGLWNHAYDYGPDNTNKAYTIQGLNASNHAAYSRDALKLLLQTCPHIDSLFFRVHFEGGIPEPTHEFWKVVLEGLKGFERPIEVSFHAKGVDRRLIDIASGTGMKVVVAPKYWGEHLGPSYHQASIRNREFHPRVKDISVNTESKKAGSTGTEVTAKRSFTRYGYADYFTENRDYEVVHRVWPGTQRLLTWGDPASAAGYGRAGTFEGSSGFEWFEPLSFKGRKGSGTHGGRELFVDTSLQMGLQDWTKYSYTYRLLGRLTYNPEANPETWRRFLRSEFQDAAAPCEEAMASASRILPFILLVHAPSVANNVYWPEMYTNMPLLRNEPADGKPAWDKFGHPVNYDFDTEIPRTFGSASSLDPELIYRVDEFADDILQGKRSGKYSPLEVAERLEALAENALASIGEAEKRVGDSQQPSFRRWAVDVRIMAGIGQFFANKFHAGLAFAFHQRTGDIELLRESIDYYGRALAAWRQIINVSAGVYKEDITFGLATYSRGHWSDRLAAIEADIAGLERLYRNASEDAPRRLTVGELMEPFRRGYRPFLHHVKGTTFSKDEPFPIEVHMEEKHPHLRVWLHYRHVNQAEPYVVQEMMLLDRGYRAEIPAEYMDSPYSLQYFFEVGYDTGDRWLVPEFEETLSNQPYYVVSRAGRTSAGELA